VPSSVPKDAFALVGTVLQNEYRVDAVIGEGGFGVVYRGVHLGLEQPVAIKVLKGLEREDARTQDLLLTKFKEEARLLYTLSQQSLSIVRSMDFGALTAPNGAWAPFMVLEWLEGCSLAEDIAARRARGLRGRSVDEALALLEPAALGLRVAHERRIAHRDIKPANIFLLASGHPNVKVLDFGIAKMMQESEEKSTKGTLASFTWLYAAPEQLDPRIGPTGLHTDVYAFALVLTELLTDAPPVDARDPLTIFRAATDRASRPTPRTREVPNVPDPIEAACLRALAVDPRERFPSITEFWTALRTRQATMAVPSVARFATPEGGKLATPAQQVTQAQQAQQVQPAVPPQRLPSSPPPRSPAQPIPQGPPTGFRPPGAPPYAPVTGPPVYIPTGAPMVPPWTGPAPLGITHTGPPHLQTTRRPLPPRPAETSSVVPVFVVLFVLALLFAGSCAVLHAACS
jgi:serine/threonine protein kinase